MSKTETGHAGDFIMSEANGKRSREVITILSGQNLASGSVVGKVTASGKYVSYDNAQTDGAQAAAAIIIYDADASLADVEVTALVRDAEVNINQLVYDSSQDASAKAAAVVDLAALGIIAR